jgi:hypothetical protein
VKPQAEANQEITKTRKHGSTKWELANSFFAALALSAALAVEFVFVFS